MFGTINIHAGDFKKDMAAGFLIADNKFYFGVPGKVFQTEKIPIADVEELEVATEDSVKKLGGTVGWGLAGAVLLGPVGLLAGLLLGGKKKTITFVCKFKDGRKFLGTTDSKTWTQIIAARF